MRDVLATHELRGPREITSSNVDRAFDDNGQRFLLIEEKNPDEAVARGQQILLRRLATLPTVDVWFVRGNPDRLSVWKVAPEGSTRLCDGDMGAYQRQVLAWFAQPIDGMAWDRVLAPLASMPYEPPAWCPPEVWLALDLAIVATLQHRQAS
jgi:hypothetical protein